MTGTDRDPVTRRTLIAGVAVTVLAGCFDATGDPEPDDARSVDADEIQPDDADDLDDDTDSADTDN